MFGRSRKKAPLKYLGNWRAERGRRTRSFWLGRVSESTLAADYGALRQDAAVCAAALI
jgi:hypothetical protein